jgi:hypothetical protein
VIDVGRQLRRLETADDPDDERFGSAKILGVGLSADTSEVSLSLTSLAGDDVAVIVPLTVAPQTR